MVIQFGVKEHIRMAETYRWAEEELVKGLRIQGEMIEDSKRYWNGETAETFRQDYENMLQEGEYASFLKYVRGMKEVMEESIPRFRRLQQMVVELPTAYGLPCDEEAPDTLRLDEEAVARYHELSDEIIERKYHFYEEMTSVMDGCEGLVDFSEDRCELEKLLDEIQQMKTYKRMLDEYADEMRRMDNWMVERLSEYVKIGDGGSMTGKGIASKEYLPERTGICRNMNRDNLPAEITDVSELGVYSYVFGNVSTVEMEQYLDDMYELCENGWISEEERKYLQSLLTASTHVPDSEKTIIMGILRDRLSYIENTKDVNSEGYRWIQDNIYALSTYLDNNSLLWSDVIMQHVLSEYYNRFVKGNAPILPMAGVEAALYVEILDWDKCLSLYVEITEEMKHCYGTAEKIFIDYMIQNKITDPAAHMIVLNTIRETNPQLLLNLLDGNSDKEAEELMDYYYSMQEGMTFSLEQYSALRDLELASYHLNGRGNEKEGVGRYNGEELIGIMPYYVMVNATGGGFIDDGGITFGIGHNILAVEWQNESDREHEVLSGYLPEDVMPTGISVDTLPGCMLIIVPGSTMVPIEEVNRIFMEDIQEFSNKVANDLEILGVEVTQAEFDALVIYAYNRGSLSSDALDYLSDGNRNREDWQHVWSGGNNRIEYCQTLFFSEAN